MGLRRKSRELALQTLFSIEFNEHLDNPYLPDKDYHLKFAEIVENSDIRLNNAIEEFAISLIEAVLEHKVKIDERIQNHLINWTVNNIGNLDKSILRIAIAEMFYLDTPYQVAINEAVEIAKRYSAENSAKFINGILDKIKDELPDKKN